VRLCVSVLFLLQESEQSLLILAISDVVLVLKEQLRHLPSVFTQFQSLEDLVDHEETLRVCEHTSQRLFMHENANEFFQKALYVQVN
jgi:hypothetical protein